MTGPEGADDPQQATRPLGDAAVVRLIAGREIGQRVRSRVYQVTTAITVAVIVAAAVILVTAVLVAMPPPADVTANAAHAVSVPTNPPTEVLR